MFFYGSPREMPPQNLLERRVARLLYFTASLGDCATGFGDFARPLLDDAEQDTGCEFLWYAREIDMDGRYDLRHESEGMVVL